MSLLKKISKQQKQILKQKINIIKLLYPKHKLLVKISSKQEMIQKYKLNNSKGYYDNRRL